MKRQDLAILCLLCLVTIFLRLGYLVEPPNIDQSLLSTAAKEILAGKSLYQQTWIHHCPVVYYLYAVGMYLTGEEVGICNLLEIVNTVVAGLLVFYLLSLLLNKAAGYFGFLAYALLFNQVFLGGWYARAETEVFFEIPVLTILILAYHIRYTAISHKNKLLFAQGVLYVMLILIKIPIAPFVVCILADYLTSRQTFFAQLFYFLLGVTAACGVLILWLGWQGNLMAFIQAVFVYNFYYRDAGQPLASELLVNMVSFCVYFIAAAGVAFYGYIHYYSQPRKLIGILWWPWMALLQAIIQGKYCWHHFIHFTSAGIVLFAIGVYGLLEHTYPRTVAPRKMALVGICIILVVLAPFFYVCYTYYTDHGIFEYATGNLTKEEFLGIYSRLGQDVDVLTMWQAGQYLQSIAKPGDELFVFGMNSLYLYARLPCASKYTFIPYISTHYYHDLFLREIYEDLQSKRPRFIVQDQSGNAVRALRFNPNSANLHKIRQLLRSSYRLEKSFPQLDVYCRKP